MDCPTCKTNNLDDRKYCRECGRQLIFFCIRCGFANGMDDNFCGGCGLNLEDMICLNLNDIVDISKDFDPDAFPTIEEYEKKKDPKSEGGVKDILDASSDEDKSDEDEEEVVETDIDNLFEAE